MNMAQQIYLAPGPSSNFWFRDDRVWRMSASFPRQRPLRCAVTWVSSRIHEQKAPFNQACCLPQAIHHVCMESFAAFCIWIYEILCKFSTVMLWSKQGWIRVPLCCSYLRKLCSVNWYAIWWEIFSPHAIDRMWFGTGLRAVCLSQYIHFS